MAISAPTKSTQYLAQEEKRPNAKSGDIGSKLRMSRATLTFTAAGFTTAAAGDLFLMKMPAGKVRIYGDLSRIVCPIGTATSDLDLGIGAHNKASDGSAVALDGKKLADSLDVGGAAIDEVIPLPTVGGVTEVDSRDGFDIVASFDTANSPASGDFVVSIAYTLGN
jgi:hypothetical protein